MCGTCGVDNAGSGESLLPTSLEQMTRLISHRGPDKRGIYVNTSIGLGIARLSIIDLNGSHQPISNEIGDIWVVFNGEI